MVSLCSLSRRCWANPHLCALRNMPMPPSFLGMQHKYIMQLSTFFSCSDFYCALCVYFWSYNTARTYPGWPRCPAPWRWRLTTLLSYMQVDRCVQLHPVTTLSRPILLCSWSLRCFALLCFAMLCSIVVMPLFHGIMYYQTCHAYVVLIPWDTVYQALSHTDTCKHRPPTTWQKCVMLKMTQKKRNLKKMKTQFSQLLKVSTMEVRYRYHILFNLISMYG